MIEVHVSRGCAAGGIDVCGPAGHLGGMEAWPTQLREEQQEITLLGLAQKLRTPAAWRLFSAHHVFAVWDFMSLLKRLQRELTGAAHPWLPPTNSRTARFINEIVLAEECDEDGAGGYADHFSTYLRGMREVGADCGPIDAVLAACRAGRPWRQAIAEAKVPEPAARFVTQTLGVAEKGAVHEVAAVFLFGREALLPVLFAELLAQLADGLPQFSTLRFYFSRHIELDGDEHGPMAEQLLLDLCGDSQKKREEAIKAARRALTARRQLWQGIEEAVAKM